MGMTLWSYTTLTDSASPELAAGQRRGQSRRLEGPARDTCPQIECE
jgi:hypothetical protein